MLYMFCQYEEVVSLYILTETYIFHKITFKYIFKYISNIIIFAITLYLDIAMGIK